MKIVTQEFYKQPLEVKLKYSQPLGTVEGYGQSFVVSEDQKLDWSDMLFFFTQPTSIRNMKLWPAHPESFRDSLEKYSGEVMRIEELLARFMGKNLGLASERLEDMFKEEHQGVRINYYPPCPFADKVLGFTPHSDSVGITILLQVNEVTSLEIKRCGKWLPVKPLPGAFIVNVGDILEILSNGRYKSIEHRVLINKDNERLSIAAFHSSSFEALVGPLPELLDKESEQPRFRTMKCQEFLRMMFAYRREENNILNKMKLEE